jgi:tetratricopeptide (TPR) repeat protein/transglutaminase-like putative cysteine protease
MKPVLAGFSCLLFLVFWVVVQPAPAIAAPQAAAPNPQLPSASATAPAAPAQSPTPPDYSQEAYVIEHLRQAMRYENDGTGREQLDAQIKVISESGVQALGQLKIGYSALSDQLDIVYVRVRKPDGSVITAQESAVQDLTLPNAPVYTDYHEKHVSVPALRPGDVLEYEVVRTIVNPLTPNQFWTSYNFAEKGIVLDEELEINVPKARHIKLKTKPGYDPKVTDEGDRRIYRWRHSHLKSEPEDRKQPKIPNLADQVPSVQLSTFPSWKDLGAWYAFLERDRRKPDDAVRAKAAELVRGKTSNMEKVKALYDYVARNIRYVSLSFGLGRFQPHAAGEVLANGYGDCKDKNTLLAALLQAEGIESSSVLIGVHHRLDPEIPSPSQFDHVITRIPVDGQEIWVDSTSGVLPFRMLMLPLRDKQALLISPEGKAGLVRTPAGLPFKAYDQTHVNASLSDTGKLTAKISAVMRGDREVGIRYMLRQLPANRWQELFDNMVQRSGLKGAEISNLQVSDPSDTDNPLRISMDASANNFFDWSAAQSRMKLPFMEMNLAGMPGIDDDQKEAEKVIKLGALGQIEVEVRLTLPEKYTPHLPIGVDLHRDYAEYHSSYKLEAGQLDSVRALKVLVRELPYERVEDYAAFQRAVAADQAQTIGLENKSPGTAGMGGSESAEDSYQSGVQALKNNNYPLAVDLLQRVVKLEPKHKTAWNDLGRAYLALNQNQQAVEAFQEQIEINPYDQFAYNNLGVAYENQLRYDDARQQFLKQIEINPLDRLAHASLGMLYAKQKKYAEAVPELEKAVDLQPQNAFLQITLGQAYLASNQTEKGMAAFDKAISLAPNPFTWNNIAYSLAEQNVQLERADRYADAAINAVETQLHDLTLDNLRFQDLQTASFLYNLWDTKGWIAFKRGDLALAQRYIAAAWEASGSGNIAEHLAEIDEKLGNREQAINQYVLSLASENPNDEARARLAALGVTKGLEHRIVEGRRQLQQQRTVSLNASGKGTAEFYLLVSPKKVEQVKFIKGDEGARLADALQEADAGMKFPESSQVRVPRRGVVTCGTPADNAPRKRAAKTKSMSATIVTSEAPPKVAGPCTLMLRPADSVRTLD